MWFDLSEDCELNINALVLTCGLNKTYYINNTMTIGNNTMGFVTIGNNTMGCVTIGNNEFDATMKV